MIKIDTFKTTLQSVFSDKKNIIIAGLCVVVIIFAWNVFGSRDNDGRIDAISNDIQQAGDIDQQSADRLGAIANGLDSDTSRISDSEAGLAKIQDRIAADQATVDDIQGLIRQGKSIVKGIRERSQTGTAEIKN